MSKVLVVDDAAFMRLSIRTMLEKNGYDVSGEAADGYEAINEYKRDRPDVVTLDITMPNMTGIEALKEIKKIDPGAKVVMVTAMGQEKMVKDAVISGATSFVVKPFKEEKLIEVISGVLK